MGMTSMSSMRDQYRARRPSERGQGGREEGTTQAVYERNRRTSGRVSNHWDRLWRLAYRPSILRRAMSRSRTSGGGELYCRSNLFHFWMALYRFAVLMYSCLCFRGRSSYGGVNRVVS